MDYSFLTQTLLFRGTTQEEIKAMLSCLGASTRLYEKGETIYHVGQTVQALGLVLSGGVLIESIDLWGNNSILSHVEPGRIFAETYACVPGEPLMVDVVASEKCDILFLDVSRILTTCTSSCAHHNKLIQNHMQIAARKNLELSRRILHTSSKSIRGRLLSYLSEQVKKNGSYQFTIPFSRQQLADYLSVDRSALSNELSKMQTEGIIDYSKNSFVLKRSR